MDRPLALVVHGDAAVRDRIREALEKRGVTALDAASSADAAELLRRQPIGILLADLQAPGIEDQELLRHALRLQPAPVLVVLTSPHGGVRGAELIDAGAFDVLPQPEDDPHLQLLVERILRQRRQLEELRRMQKELQRREGYYGLVGRSVAMQRVREEIDRLALAEAPALFTGEAGTGRELAARTVHGLSRRRDRPFIVVDCVAAAEDERGDLASSVERVSGGVLYLHEVTGLSREAQEQVLALFGEKGTHDVRVLCSSTRQPRHMLEQGDLLDELHRRLTRETLHLASLSERIEDVPLLARHFIAAICEVNHLPPMQIAPETLALLERYHWPQNVRELRNAIEQATILAVGHVIRPRDLPDRIRDWQRPYSPRDEKGAAPASRGFREAKREVVSAFERAYLRDLLERHGGNVTSASQRAGMLRSALQRLLRKYGLRSAEFRRDRREPERDRDRSTAE